jgi:hypothetical protein
MRSAPSTLVRVALLAAIVVAGGRPLAPQSPICFSGPIRPQCSGFVLFEGAAVASSGGPVREFVFIPPIGQGAIVNRFHDLPSYFSGSLGYVHVVDARTAIGAVAELGYSNTSDAGNAHRVAVKARARRQFSNMSVDVDAGPLGVQIFAPDKGSCCVGRKMAYGATIEASTLWRGYLGPVVGVDVIHGAGRTSGAAHAGIRAGSYGAVTAAILTVVGVVVLVAALRPID